MVRCSSITHLYYRPLANKPAPNDALQKAIVAYRAALLEWTRERVPLDWAGTQNNLGTALKALGERESGTEKLEEAVAVFRARLIAPRWNGRASACRQWAMTQNNLGLHSKSTRPQRRVITSITHGAITRAPSHC